MADDKSFEFIYGPRRSEKKAWFVAICAMILALTTTLAFALSLPFKQTEVFTVLVDSTTGSAERIYSVQPTGIDDEDAVKEALLVSYISDRETFIAAGQEERLKRVQRDSRDQARSSLVALWTPANENYPPEIYGSKSRVEVTVRSITFLNDEVAQIRFDKTLRSPNKTPLTQTFIATVGFAFDPQKEKSIERVWENPLGFFVDDYSVDAVNLSKG